MIWSMESWFTWLCQEIHVSCSKFHPVTVNKWQDCLSISKNCFSLVLFRVVWPLSQVCNMYVYMLKPLKRSILSFHRWNVNFKSISMVWKRLTDRTEEGARLAATSRSSQWPCDFRQNSPTSTRRNSLPCAWTPEADNGFVVPPIDRSIPSSRRLACPLVSSRRCS